MNDLFQRENQVFNLDKIIGISTLWGEERCGVKEDWAGPFFPPSKMFRSFYLLFSLSVNVTVNVLKFRTL